MRAIHTLLISMLYHFLFLALPLYFSFNTQELFEFNKMLLVYVITVLVSAVWAAKMIHEKRLIISRTKLDLPILLFLVVQVAATIFSIHPYTSIWGYYSRFHGGLASTIAYIILFYGFISLIPKKHSKSFFTTLFLGAALVSVHAILEHFGHSISCLLVPAGRSFGVDCWVQDVQSRVFASFGQPNWLAAYCVLLIPVGLSLLREEAGSKVEKMLYAVATSSLFLSLLFTRSRSGLIALGVSFVMLTIWEGVYIMKNSWRKQAIYYTPQYLVTISIILLSFGWFGSVFTPSLAQLFNKPAETEVVVAPANRLEEGGTDSSEIRKIVWKGGLSVWKRYPLLGSGPETFAYSYYQDRPREHNDVSEWDFLYNKAHNELINILATTGILGLLTYLGVWLGVGILSLKAALKNNEPFLLAGIAAGLAGLFVSNFFGFSTVAVTAIQHLFFAMSLLFAGAVTLPEEKITTKITQPSSLQIVGYVGIGIITLTGLQYIWSYRVADETFLQAKNELSGGLIEQGVASYIRTIQLSPKEALWYDSLSEQYANLAMQLYSQEATSEAQIVLEQSIAASDQALVLNDQHLNFYKTRIRILANLSQIKPELLEEALVVTAQAQQKAPTDAKLVYTQAILEEARGTRATAVSALERALQLKPDYLQASWRLVELLEKEQEYTKAIEILQKMNDRFMGQDPEILKKISELETML